MKLVVELNFLNHNGEVPDRWNDESTVNDYIFRSNMGFVCLSKRSDYPTTYAKVTDSLLTIGYGNADKAVDPAAEFLTISVDLAAQSVHIARDVFCALPIFYLIEPSKLILNSTLKGVIQREDSCTFDKQALAALLLRPQPAEATLIDGIMLLGQCEELKWTAKDRVATINKATPRLEEDYSKSRPHDFSTVLEKTLKKYLLLAEAPAAFEASGGIDSATAPLYAAKNKAFSGAVLATMIFPDGYGETQSAKLEALSRTSNFPIIAEKVANQDYPLSRFTDKTGNIIPDIFYQYQEIYTEPLAKLAKALRQRSVRVVFTGIGGDELFENDNDEAIDLPAQEISFISTRHLSSKEASQQKPANLPIANSAFFAMQARNSIYIENDIWPISPLADPTLRAFSRTLPAAFRANKNILRAYHESQEFPDIIYNPEQNEHFGFFFERSTKIGFSAMIEALSKKSVLEELDIVNWEILKQEFNSSRWKEYDTDQILFAVFRVLTAEIILRCIREKT